MPSSVDPVDPVAAIGYFRAKSRLTDDEFEADASANHQKSFTLAGVADIDVIDHVFMELDKAISKGTDFREFQANCKVSLENAWGGTVANPGWRMETIFRTNVQNAYQAGRYKEAREGQTDRPYGLFSDVQDQRESDICGDIGDDIRGKAIALDDPIWNKVWPPNHHDCRSDVITLTEAEAIEQGLLDPEDVPSPEDVEVADGFDSTPDSYEPDPEEYGELQADVERFVPELDSDSVMHAIRKHFNENHDADGKFGTGDGGSGGSGGSHVSIKEHDKVQKAAIGIFGREISHKDIQDFVGVHGLDIPGAHSIEHQVRPYGADGIHLEAHVKDKEGKTLLEVKRQIHVEWETGSKQIEVHHDKMIVSKELQGKGIGSKLFDRQLEHYKSLGVVNHITTDAAWTGQYQWPRLGFGLRNPAHLDGLKSELAQFAHEKGLKIDLSKVKTVHDLSKLAVKEPFEHDGEAWTKLGKAFLSSRPEGHEIGLKFDIGPKSKEMKDYVKSGKH